MCTILETKIKHHFVTESCYSLIKISHGCVMQSFGDSISVLRIRGGPVVKSDPLHGRVIQHDTRSRAIGDTTLDK